MTATDGISWFPSGKSADGAKTTGAVVGNWNSPDDAIVPSAIPKTGAEAAGEPEGAACMGAKAVSGGGVQVFMARDDGEVRAMGDAGPVGVFES